MEESRFTFKRKLGFKQTSGSIAANIVAAPDEAEVLPDCSEDATAIIVKDSLNSLKVVKKILYQCLTIGLLQI